MEGRRKATQKSFLKKAWTVRFVSSSSRHTHVVKIKPMHIILALVLIFSAAMALVRHNTQKIKAKEEQLVALKDSSVQQEQIIDTLKVEKKQISNLVEKQNHEMSAKLEALEKKSNEVRKIVGIKTDSKSIASRKRPLRGSRGGNASVFKIRNEMKVLSHKLSAQTREMSLLEVEAKAFKKEQDRQRMLRMLEAIPSQWPASGAFMSGYGMRMHPIYGYERFHSGIDIAAPYGSSIYATAYGTVTYSDYYSGYGYTVLIDHGNGITTLYGHCSALMVKQGDVVRKGQLIAQMGSTGVSTGSHVHYEVQMAGSPVNPEPYLEYSGMKLAQLKKRFGIN
ncbi:MAG: M23 family metallopeptidase [Candidatus Eremiobacteraeota bacterium]|nr:M23 family metallopeptidase [Candidatus Eremiobacteraeota bacterium]